MLMRNSLLTIAVVIAHLLAGCHIYKVSNRSDENIQMKIECTPQDAPAYENKDFNKAISNNAIDSLTIGVRNYEFIIFPKKYFTPTNIINHFNDISRGVIISLVKANKIIDTIYMAANGKVHKNLFTKKSYIYFIKSEYLIK